MRRPTAPIPYAGVARLRHARLRTLALRAGLGVALVGLLLTQVKVADHSDPLASRLLPSGTSGVLVLDLSYSIDPQTYRTIANTLSRLADANRPLGLVAFSDTAYVLLPPGSPGRALRPMIRYFTPLNPGAPDISQRFPANPWSGFRAGTRISQGLLGADQALKDAHVRNGRVILMSDLNAPEDDVGRITNAITYMEARGVRLKIMPLSPSPDDLAFFRRIAGPDAFVSATGLSGRVRAGTDRAVLGGIPWLFVVLGIALALVVAANERLLVRLEVAR